MKLALLSPGETMHVMHRRRFEKDVRRHFAGLLTPENVGGGFIDRRALAHPSSSPTRLPAVLGVPPAMDDLRPN